MKKISVDFQYLTSPINFDDYQNQVTQINESMNNFSAEGFDFLGWKDLPANINWQEFAKMEKATKFLYDNKVEVLVVIGIGGSYLGAKAGIDFIQGLDPVKQGQKMEVIFIGNSISSSAFVRTLKYVENKKFAINVISKSGTTTEPAIAFREFKILLEEKVGKNNASNFIFATTDANSGTLFNLAEVKKYQKFVIPDNVGGRFSIFTPVGIFPMMAAGIDVKKVLNGAREANEYYSSDNLNDNDAYKYAVARHVLGKQYAVEMLISYEPDMMYFNEWWKQLFGESEGKNQKGLLPTSAIFSTDLHSLGQYIQEGSKILFETVITLKHPKLDYEISDDSENLDNLNYLLGKTIHEVNNAAFQATIDAHTFVGKNPNIHILLEDNYEESFGWLIMFFERACAMSAYLLGVNPFNQPGVEVYKANMFKILGKPQK